MFDASRDVADALIQADPTWPDQLVDQLASRLGADTIGFTSYLRHGILETKSANFGGPPLSADERAVWTAYWWQYPFMQRFMVAGDGAARRNSDLVGSMRSFRRTTLYGEHFQPRGARFQANLGWEAGGVRTGIGLYRERHDFTVDEMSALERTRQLMSAAAQYRSVLDLLELEQGSSANGSRSTTSQTLTPRQQAVLALVATGATDAQIARRLQITERTVRKHVGDVFSRLKVDNRVAAAQWWLTSMRK
jgi:DNA-binding CsgD family transcriptional regulator